MALHRCLTQQTHRQPRGLGQPPAGERLRAASVRIAHLAISVWNHSIEGRSALIAVLL